MAVKKTKTEAVSGARTAARTAIVVAVITLLGTIVVALINASLNAKRSANAQLPLQQTTGSPDSTQVSIQTGSNSQVTISESFNKTTINNFEARRAFMAPAPATLELQRKRAREFRDAHPGVQIVVEAETGSVARYQLAQTLGAVLSAEKVGHWHGGTSMGIATGAAITLLHAPQQQELARDVARVFDGYLKATGDLKEAPKQMSNTVRLYLYGTPTFSTNGLVTLE